MSKQSRKDQKKKVAGQDANHKPIQRMSDEEHHAMIAEAAYLLAEQRGFQGDAALDDWLRAESEINARLSTGE